MNSKSKPNTSRQESSDLEDEAATSKTSKKPAAKKPAAKKSTASKTASKSTTKKPAAKKPAAKKPAAKKPAAKSTTKKPATRKSSSSKSRSSGSSATDTSTSRSTEEQSVTQDLTSSASQPSVESSVPAIGNTQRQWFKADLHLHTMASSDYEQPDATYLEWMRRAAEQGLDVVAVTDHNTVAGIGAIRKEIEWLTRLEEDDRLKKDEKAQLEEWRELSEKVLLLPGFEFTATFGFHILGIFPPDTPTRQLELVLLQLNIPPDKLDAGSTETGASTDVLSAYRIIREAGGLAIAAHANSTHGVAMRDFPFGGQTKIAYTQDQNLDALEVTDLERRGRSTARFFNGTKAEYARRMHCIQGSDAHCVVANPKKPKRLGIGDRSTDLSLMEKSFDAIAELLRGDEFNRTRPARPKDQPYDAVENARDEGPGIALSFHETAGSRGGKLAAVLSDICAFGNTVGGTIFVGANHKKTKPKGLAKPADVQAEIQEALTERVTPPITVKFEVCETQDQKVLQIQVPKGSDRPYCLDEYKFYIRDESDTNQAVRDEIVALVKAVLEEERRSTSDNSGNNRNRNSRSRGGRGRGSRGRGNGNESSGDSGSNNDRNTASSNNTGNNNAGNKTASSNTDKSRDGNASKSGGRNNGRNNGQNRNRNAPSKSDKGSSDDAFYLPQIGVEVIESIQRNGHQVHCIRDMRNGNVIKNVTRKGSRKLWNYAIQNHEDKVVEKATIQWDGDIGLIHVDRRAGKVRYDLALRENGGTRVFYGVTEDGMEGRWNSFIQDE